MATKTFSIVGSGTAQSDDAEITSVDELSTTSNLVNSLTLNRDILLEDMLTTATLASSHQVAIWVDGQKRSSNFYSAQLDPANPSRFRIGQLGLAIRKGAVIQIRTAQKAGSIEAGKLTLVYKEINLP